MQLTIEIRNSVSCHTDHDIVELELRRQFRCDCGTTKIPQNQCMLKKGLYEASTENRYNHNFQGKFCHCESDYIPELEERTLIQCLICEDWIHDTCILKEVDLCMLITELKKLNTECIK
jgi:E3 ubiquitin-protein ligase UBR7